MYKESDRISVQRSMNNNNSGTSLRTCAEKKMARKGPQTFDVFIGNLPNDANEVLNSVFIFCTSRYLCIYFTLCQVHAFRKRKKSKVFGQAVIRIHKTN